MISNFFNIPYVIAIAISDAIGVILSSLEYVWILIFDSIGNVTSIGSLFFVSIAISFIFVAIKFIRSFVWGA